MTMTSSSQSYGTSGGTCNCQHHLAKYVADRRLADARRGLGDEELLPVALGMLGRATPDKRLESFVPDDYANCKEMASLIQALNQSENDVQAGHDSDMGSTSMCGVGLGPEVAVTIVGLQNKAHLNGREGICTEFIPATRRWYVRLPLAGRDELISVSQDKLVKKPTTGGASLSSARGPGITNGKRKRLEWSENWEDWGMGW